MIFKEEDLSRLEKQELVKMILVMQEGHARDRGELRNQVEGQAEQIGTLLTRNYELQLDAVRLTKVLEEQSQEMTGLKSRIAQLEKHSGNSSKPPSSDGFNGPTKKRSLREKI